MIDDANVCFDEIIVSYCGRQRGQRSACSAVLCGAVLWAAHVMMIDDGIACVLCVCVCVCVRACTRRD